LALAGGSAWANDAAVPEVGRVSIVAGPAEYQPSEGTWAGALANEPVAPGVGLRTAADAEAELRLANGRVALASTSTLKVLRLDREAAQIALTQGRLGIHLDGAAQTVEVDMPHGAVWLAAPGDYDIVAGDDAAPTRIAVFTGKALLGGGLGETNLVAAERDSFSDWWRSQSDDADAASGSHLSAGIAGVAALDAAGTWKSDPTYGAVWYPGGVADDWAPYRDGVWRFLPPGGWTWIDNATWGFAPSHYGRWTRLGDRWAWVPPAQDAATDYSPAAVAFLGTAPIGLSCPGSGGPAVAWFALAPGETIGDGNDENYKNRRFATAVPRSVFAAGKPVASALVDLPEQRFADAPVILGPLGIPPILTSVVAAAAKRSPPAAAAVAAAAHPAPALAVAKPAAVKLAAVATRKTGKAASKSASRRTRIALALSPRKRTTLAIVPAAVRARPAPSTSGVHSTHTRQHLAAVRGGA
jgi:hypothetical protein